MASVTPGLVWAVKSGDHRSRFVAAVGSFPVSETRGPKGAVLSTPSLCLAQLCEDSSFEPEAKMKSLRSWVGEGPKRPSPCQMFLNVPGVSFFPVSPQAGD